MASQGGSIPPHAPLSQTKSCTHLSLPHGRQFRHLHSSAQAAHITFPSSPTVPLGEAPENTCLAFPVMLVLNAC